MPRLGTVKRALDDMASCFECVLCMEPFDNQHRRVAFLDPCKHEYVEHARVLIVLFTKMCFTRIAYALTFTSIISCILNLSLVIGRAGNRLCEGGQQVSLRIPPL